MIELIACSVTVTNQHAYCYCLLSLLASSVLWMESRWVPKLILCALKTLDQLILENLTAKLPSLNLLSQGDRCSHRALPLVGSPSARPHGPSLPSADLQWAVKAKDCTWFHMRGSPGFHISILNYQVQNKLQVGPAGLRKRIIAYQAGPSQVAQLTPNEIQPHLKVIQLIRRF